MRRPFLLLLCLLAGVPVVAADGDDPVAGVLARFTAYDVDGDGTVEIRRLEVVHDTASPGLAVLVLAEPRLLTPLGGAVDLRDRLVRLVEDLAHEGYRALVVTADLEAGTTHRDGRILLALREVLRALRSTQALAGVLLVGHFPDAYLVRTCTWHKRGKVVLRQGASDAAAFDGVPYLRRVPEAVAHRADIVLSDLDGRWEDVYVEPRSQLPTTVAVYPEGIPEHGGPCADFERGSVTFEDFFHVSDGDLEVQEDVQEAEPVAGRVTGTPLAFVEAADHEVGAADRNRPNAIARPDILVSRIDARGVALRPRADVVGVDGNHLLDAKGRPQAVRFASEAEVPHWRDGIWEADPVLERRLLAAYLDRNHAYRRGESSVAWRPASLAHGLGSGYTVVRRAAQDWTAADPSLVDVRGRPTLAQVVSWLQEPAVLRTVRAHSDPWGSTFARGGFDDLVERAGEVPWSWTPHGDRLEPSLAAACRGGKLDWFLLRTLWENQAVAPEPTFYLHTGCEILSPPSAGNRAYVHPAYGQRAGGDSLLLFGSGLALAGRAKVFYDEPRGFCDALAEGETFGAAWARYFDIESRARSWSEVGGDIGRKRSYFWSLIGDWTLRLRRRHPLGPEER